MSGFHPYLPDDFLSFWHEAQDEAAASPIDFTRDRAGRVDAISFRSVSGEQLHGWLACPQMVIRVPGFLWVAPYGRESMLPNEFGTREGMASFSFNFFGHDAFHQEPYVPERGYFAEGLEAPSAHIFRRMYQNASIAMRVLAAQAEVDEDRLAAMGMSQGGGISIWLGAWCPQVRAVCADMPFLGAFGEASEKVYRYPMKEVADFAASHPGGMDRVRKTMAYFDTMNQATQCRVPTHVSLGLKDPSARPKNVRAIFDALPGEKTLVEYDWGHDWHPEMITRNREWLSEKLG
jgi:cephalosporin-C deacetylase